MPDWFKAGNPKMDLRQRILGLVEQRLPTLSEIERKDLEIGMFNWALEYADKQKMIKSWRNPRFASAYLEKARSVITNLDPSSYVGNQRLMDRLREGEFVPHHLAGMKNNTLHPERWRDLLDKKLRRDEHVYQEKPAAMTAEFRCSKCRKRECIYQELQLRSCDEPVTLFITCLNCGHRWRMG
jgi:DNA-directed RNA polymerase subunit M/transcription elongation factor TFIIS